MFYKENTEEYSYYSKSCYDKEVGLRVEKAEGESSD